MKVINVLSPYYYQDCHIKDSINIPLESLAEAGKTLDKNEEIILYCAHYQCPASKKAWHILNELGFTNIKAYEGGIVEWYQRGYPIDGEANEPYLLQSHAKEKDDSVKTISAQELFNKITQK